MYEEEYLVNSIGRLIERGNSVSEEVTRLVEGLMRRAMRERAAAVESAMVDVLDRCTSCVQEVFQVEQLSRPSDGMNADEDYPSERPKGGDGVFWDSQEEQQRKRDVPVIKPFTRLSLLG